MFDLRKAVTPRLGGPCLLLSGLLLAAGRAEAVQAAFLSFSPDKIINETVGGSTGTAINFNIDTEGSVQINIAKVQNVGDTGTPVASLTQLYNSPGNKAVYWNALWLINGELGRTNGLFSAQVVLSTASGSSIATSSTLLEIDSIDIHDVGVLPAFDAAGLPTFPYTITYSLAKEALVKIVILDADSTIVRTLVNNELRAGEAVTTHAAVWDGLGDNGRPVAVGLYTLNIDATEASDPNPLTADRAVRRSRQIAVQTVVGATTDPQKLFEESVYIAPNPVREGNARIYFQPVRDNARVSVKIYSIAGDLVYDQEQTVALAGTISFFEWRAVNQAGSRVGRGLYYVVLREEDSAGDLQTVKKMAVIQ